MIKIRFVSAVLLLTQAAFLARAETEVSPPTRYTGMCDASAAVALTDQLFAVASDEDSVVRIYQRDRGGPPVQSIDLSAFLDLDPKKPESDIEAAARVGDRIYWITSHGRNRNGRERPSRERFFATQITTNATGVELKMVGKPYERLLSDLLGDSRLKSFKLAEASRREPKAPQGLNIEGLSATPEGHLLIGFRNPLPGGRALLVPLLNPDDVIRGKPAKLGDPALLDLDGLGIRDMTYWKGKYLIIGGSYDGQGSSHLYRWLGGPSAPRMAKHARLKGLNPEAIIIYPDKGLKEVQLLSDDGRVLVNGKPCKEVAAPDRRSFRSVWVVN